MTSTRDFVLVGEDAAGCPAKLESFRLADSTDDFRCKRERPRAYASAVGVFLGEYLARVLSHGRGKKSGAGPRINAMHCADIGNHAS